MDIAQIKETILRELPVILKQDAEIQRLVLRLSREHFADKEETESRFDRLLEELRQDREERKRQWAEESLQWKEQNRKWGEQNSRWEEQNRQRPITRRLIISPMVSPQAQETAAKLGIEVYGYARDAAL